jgi:hypothetical protein
MYTIQPITSEINWSKHKNIKNVSFLKHNCLQLPESGERENL